MSGLLISNPSPNILKVTRRLSSNMKKQGTGSTFVEICILLGAVAEVQVGTLGTAQADMRVPHTSCSNGSV